MKYKELIDKMTLEEKQVYVWEEIIGIVKL